MNFKDYVASDLTNVFLNTDEFAESVSINGTTVKVVPDNEQLQYRILRDVEGLIDGDILFHVSISEYAKIPLVKHAPRAGDALTYGGKPGTITDVILKGDLYEIIIKFIGAR